MSKGNFILGISIKKTRLSLERRQEILRKAGYPEAAEKLPFEDMARKKRKNAL